jgi:uncharacterized protein (TIGR03790 family)
MAASRCQKLIVCACVLGALVLATPAAALEPAEVVVIANEESPEGLALAQRYLRKRRIPADQLVRVRTTLAERCTRVEYEQEIRRPVRAALERLGPERRIRCLVTMYGLPLAVHAAPGEQAGGAADTRASVDSELALVLADDYPLAGWIANPYFLGFRDLKTPVDRDHVLMVARLDGPDPAAVRRLMDDARAVERRGLAGAACFDARWRDQPLTAGADGYRRYDSSLHAAASMLRIGGRLAAVRIDDREELFRPGDCPETALYCGWYSLNRYVDAFTWARGAVAYHLASGECATLRTPGSQGWCQRMIEEGVAATIGPVNEPYVQAFPPPDLFFPTLVEGWLSLGETWLVTLPYLSWQMVLIGDPLYRPFAPR